MLQQIAAPKSIRAFPRIGRVDAINKQGCLFHIASPAENFRVEKFGGEEVFTRMILDEIRPGDVLFDIGACIGFVSIHAALAGAKVVAFEPDPGFRQRLTENLKLNKIDGMTVMPWAVSDSDGTVELYTDGVTGTSPSLVQTGSRPSVTVRAGSVDSGIENNLFPVPQVVKIDVEGAESHVLRGMRRLLDSPRAPRSIFIELHPAFLPNFGSSMEEVEGLFAKAGYHSTYDTGRFDQVHRVYRR